MKRQGRARDERSGGGARREGREGQLGVRGGGECKNYLEGCHEVITHAPEIASPSLIH